MPLPGVLPKHARRTAAPKPLATSSSQSTTKPLAAPPARTLLMHYMVWYQTPARGGAWGFHWTGPGAKHHPDRAGADGLPDIWSHYHPLIGPYDSADPDAIECHLLQMKLAGIDGVIVDWYGCADAADYPPIHRAACAVFDAAARLKMKFAVCYEDRSIEYLVGQGKLRPDQAAGQLADTFKWMQDHWFSHEQYFRLGGRPLVLNFGPIYVRDPAAWRAHAPPCPTAWPSSPLATSGSPPAPTAVSPGSTPRPSRAALTPPRSDAAWVRPSPPSRQSRPDDRLGVSGLPRRLRAQPARHRPQRREDASRLAPGRPRRPLADRPTGHVERLRRGHDDRADP